MAPRNEWKKLSCREYLCPHCKRDKGMLYMFPDGTLRYVCFCGANVTTGWVAERYNFDKKKFSPEKDSGFVQIAKGDDNEQSPEQKQEFASFLLI